MKASQLIENRSVLTILRDCLKLANRMVEDPVKAKAVRALIKREFLRHKDEFQQEKILLLKMNAAKGISNYLIYNAQKEYNLEPNKNIFEEEEEEEEEDELDEGKPEQNIDQAENEKITQK